MSKLSALDSKQITNCQVCQSEYLRSLIFLGFVPPVNEMLGIESISDAEMRFPLELLRCENCSLVQIGYEVDQRILFPHTYPYLSGTTRILRENFKDLANEINTLFGIRINDVVLDVGANDGTLLMPFKELGYRVLGIEPSQAAEIAINQGIPIVKDYFGKKATQYIHEKYGKMKIITAANVFAHIKDVHEIVDAITHLLDQDGVFVSESHYLLDLVETLQYDTIYHEHLRYYSLNSLIYLFKKHGLEVFRVKRIPTHGGSIRVYAARTGNYPIHKSVTECLAAEQAFGLIDGNVFDSFRSRIIQSKLELLKLLCSIKAEKKRVVGIGAPSRATTLINYAGLDDGLIDSVMEVSTSHKLNKFVPGTRIPVVNEERLYDEQQDYALMFSWHIGDELAKHLFKKGFQGDIIIPLPTPRIVTSAQTIMDK